MHSRCSELTELVEAGSRQIVGALRIASDEGLSVRQMTELLGAALRQRNQMESARWTPPPSGPRTTAL
jgi:hypothetical protein